MPKTRVPIGEFVKRFLAKHGVTPSDPITAAVTELATENYRYRDRLRTASSDTPYKEDARVAELERDNERLEDENTRLGALVPVAGTLVLTADQKKTWELYTALGKPEDLKKSIDELPALKAKVSDTDLGAQSVEAATLLGWNPDATKAAIKDKGLVLTFVPAKDKDGKDTKVPHVRAASDEKATPVALTDWITTNASYLRPSLETKADTTATPPGQPAPVTGTSFPPLSGGSPPASTGDAVLDFQKRTQTERDSRPNPFFPARKAASGT